MELVIALSAGVPYGSPMSFPRVRPDSRGGARDRPHARARGPRGVVRRRRAAGHPARRSSLRLSTSPPRPRPQDVQRLFRRTAPVGVKYGTVGVLDRHARAARGHHLPARRRAPTGAMRWSSTASRSRRISPAATSPSTRIAYHPLRQRVARSVRRRAPISSAGSSARSAIRPQRFREDYLRILRALRFAARFGFAIDPATWAAARAAAGGLARLSAERVRDEWFKGLRTAQDLAELVRLWHEVGAAAVWLPELATSADAGPARRSARRPAARSGAAHRAARRRSRGRAAPARRRPTRKSARASAMARGPAAPAGTGEIARAALARHGGQGRRRSRRPLPRCGTAPSAPWARCRARDPGAPRSARPG